MPRSTRRHALQAAAATAGTAAVSTSAARAAGQGPSPECGERHDGYTAEERRRSYARFFTGATAPPQPPVSAALGRGPVPDNTAPRPSELGADVARTGYGPLETGYGRTGGLIHVAALTAMPGVRPEMWDWWFGWHSDASAKYKLWHPDAHRFAALREDRVRTPGLSDRQRYVGNTSYVDEYIGTHLQQLAITFVEPEVLGVDLASSGGTVVCGRVGTPLLPVDAAILSHQIRRTPDGSEMRSRFWLNRPGLHPADGHAAACAFERGIPGSQRLPPFGLAYAALLLEHCGSEMNHLAQFLPELYAQEGPPSTRPLELDARPQRLAADRWRIDVTVTAGGEPVPEVRLGAGGLPVRTDRAGAASVRVGGRRGDVVTVRASRRRGAGAMVDVRLG